MQPRLTAVRSRPCRLRPRQPHASARAVEMHLVLRGEQCCDVIVAKEIGRPMRSVDHSNPPVAGQYRSLCGCQRARSLQTVRILSDMQHVSRLQRAGGVAAEHAEREHRARSENLRRIETAAHGEIAALARALDFSDRKRLTRPYYDR